MSEYIDRRKFEQLITERDLRTISTKTIGECLDKAEADVVEVVRCKDCKWWTKQGGSLQGRCALMQSYPTGAWYCANGEREDDE